jgi:ABC-type uncharacterized transport system involved in gliding motility auxiliary subunit
MRGGKLIVFVDQTEIDLGARTGRTTQSLKGVPTEPGLTDLLEHYGVRVGKTVLQDRKNVKVIVPEVDPATQRMIGQSAKPYLSWIRVEKDQLNQENPISSTVQGLTLFWPSPLEIVHENLRGSATCEILASTSNEAWTVEDLAANFDPASQTVAQSDKWQSFPVAALVKGRFQSFYKGKEIPKPVNADGTELPNAPTNTDKKTIEESAHETEILVVGDADFIDDDCILALHQQLVRQMSGAGQDMARQNISFALNAAESFSLGTDVMQIRSRQIKSREIDMAKVSDGSIASAKLLNQYLMPAAVLLVGLLWWAVRAATTRIPVPVGATPARTASH